MFIAFFPLLFCLFVLLFKWRLTQNQMIIIQHREVGFDIEEAVAPELGSGETFGDDAATDVSWTTQSVHENALDALCGFVAAINADEIDDVNLYYRVIDTDTGEIRGL